MADSDNESIIDTIRRELTGWTRKAADSGDNSGKGGRQREETIDKIVNEGNVGQGKSQNQTTDAGNGY
jgi:hypothetical protein